MTLFNPGQIVCTQGVHALVSGNHVVLWPFLQRHLEGDWGEVDAEDKKTNDHAAKSGERLLSCYTIRNEKVWVITEWDRSVTTFLLPDEY